MRVFIAGHTGMVGSAIMRRMSKDTGYDVVTATRAQLDLTDQSAVRAFLQHQRPDAVILAAARVGGILANATYPAPFIYDNMMIAANVIHQSYATGIQRLLFMGSSCIYPRDTPQPIPESALMTGALEPTNAPYAIAKIAGIKLCESYNQQYGTDFRCLMPTNLFGPADNFHPDNAHVLPAMIQRFHSAIQNNLSAVTIWGSGTPRREFLHVDDLADATLHVLGLDRTTYEAATYPGQSHLNVGTGSDVTIMELARTIARITGFDGKIACDSTKPDGTRRKLLDVRRLTGTGWQAKISLHDGIAETVNWYRDQLQRGHALRSV